MEKMKKKESPASFARRLGVNRATISRAIQEGRLILEDGFLDIEDSLRRWEETKSGQRPDVAARHAAFRSGVGSETVQESATPDEPAEIDSAPAATGLASHMQDLLAAQNALARLSLQMMTNKRYPLESILREAQSLGALLRGALERLVDQTAPRLAVLSDQAARSELLNRELAILRRTILREMLRAMRRLRQSGKGA